HVTFRYSEKSSLVLHDVSLNVDAGAFIAIVGASGSGKSSLLRLLLGFETPESGAILYEGQNLTQLNIRDLRRQIGVVLQEGQLMADSISNNIAGARTLSLEEIWEAATMAGIADDIRQMPMGMSTYVNEGAANISGGQKQRILIARALATKPRILFLDEATSALDNASQNIVKESLERLSLTRIIIAHRLSSITHADRIYVLDNGRIIEEGTYDELIKKGGAFTRLAQRQIA
ncbi:MAG: ATP-binding cassette domain-containing protein, partial [Methanomicrobiales archaeon]